MSNLFHFMEDFHPVANNDGDINKDDAKSQTMQFEVLTSDWYGDERVYIRTTDVNGKYTTYELSKKQTESLRDGVESAGFRVGHFK